MRIHTLAIIALSLGSPMFAGAMPACTTATLKGTYLWTGTGSTAPAGTWVPKAIVEQLSFDGTGTVTVLAATVADRLGDGQVVELPPGITGSYTVEPGCTGKVRFVPGAPNFDLVLAHDGRVGSFIQTDANNVLQGTLRHVSH